MARYLAEFIDECTDLWELLVPPVPTPEEKIADARALLHDQKNAMMIERWQIQAELKKAEAAIKKATPTRDVTEIEYAVTQKVQALQRRADWDERHQDALYTQQNLSRVHDDMTLTNATLSVMAAVNAQAPEPARATQVLTRYQLQSQQTDLINQMVREVMEQRREDQAEARAEKRGETDKEVERLTQRALQQANHQLMNKLEPVNSRVLSPSIIEGSNLQLRQKNQEVLRRTDLFLAQGEPGK